MTYRSQQLLCKDAFGLHILVVALQVVSDVGLYLLGMWPQLLGHVCQWNRALQMCSQTSPSAELKSGITSHVRGGTLMNIVISAACPVDETC